MDSDIEVSRASSFSNGGENATGTINSNDIARLSDVSVLDIGDDVEVGKIYGKTNDSDDTIAQTIINSIGTLLLTDIPSLMIGTDSTNGEFDIGGIALGDDEGDTGVNQITATAQGTVTMANVKAEVQSTVRVGVIDISSSLEGGNTVPSSATTSNAFGTLTLQSSSLDSPSVEVGMVAANHEGTATGSLELSPSYLKADQLIVGEGAGSSSM
ncbi:hypothetical protein BST95_15550 [Halioglobus japonicus]|nr:hypothetical protein BST95_15550 [Halioglobus japonicus]GHD08119.1 hypothetical protein GCM10007052_04680 [Halioglobus japonicus]